MGTSTRGASPPMATGGPGGAAKEDVSPGHGTAGQLLGGVLVLLILEKPAHQVGTGIETRPPRSSTSRSSVSRAGTSSRDLMCARVAAITRYSAATSMYDASSRRGTRGTARSRKRSGCRGLDSSCFFTRCSSRSSGPSKQLELDEAGLSPRLAEIALVHASEARRRRGAGRGALETQQAHPELEEGAGGPEQHGEQPRARVADEQADGYPRGGALRNSITCAAR